MPRMNQRKTRKAKSKRRPPRLAVPLLPHIREALEKLQAKRLEVDKYSVTPLSALLIQGALVLLAREGLLPKDIDLSYLDQYVSAPPPPFVGVWPAAISPLPLYPPGVWPGSLYCPPLPGAWPVVPEAPSIEVSKEMVDRCIEDLEE